MGLRRVSPGWLARSIEAARAFEKAHPAFVQRVRENWQEPKS